MKPYPQAHESDPQKFFDCLHNGTRIVYDCPPDLPYWDDLFKKCNMKENVVNRGQYDGFNFNEMPLYALPFHSSNQNMYFGPEISYFISNHRTV